MEQKKGFINISEKECLIVYRDVLNNSTKKWRTARLLARNNDFGTASNLLITSIEELVKALVIFLDGNGFKLRKVKGAKGFFTDHQLRHVIAFLMSVTNIFGEDIIDLLKAIKADNTKLFTFMKSRDTMASNIKEYLLSKIVAIMKESEWYSHMDKLRQNGLYSDYDGEVKIPINISKRDYMSIYRRMEKIRAIGRMLIISIARADGDSLNAFNQMKDEFKTKNHYLKLEGYLATLHKAKFEKGIFFPIESELLNFKNLLNLPNEE